LKRLVCIWRERDCPRCLVARTCVYPYVFETPMVRVNEDREEASPHPFVLTLAAEWQQRQIVQERVGVTLMGDGCTSWPYVLQALREAGERGVGRESVPMRLRDIEQETQPGSGFWESIWQEQEGVHPFEPRIPNAGPCPKILRLRLETPVRLRLRQQLVRPESLQPEQFLAAIERRVAVLTKLHAGRVARPEERSAARWAERTRELDRRLHWQDWERYSNRQKRKVPMGGIVGEWVWEVGENWDGWALLWLSQWLHVGKGTSMGLGRFRVEAM